MTHSLHQYLDYHCLFIIYLFNICAPSNGINLTASKPAHGFSWGEANATMLPKTGGRKPCVPTRVPSRKVLTSIHLVEWNTRNRHKEYQYIILSCNCYNVHSYHLDCNFTALWFHIIPIPDKSYISNCFYPSYFLWANPARHFIMIAHSILYNRYSISTGL